MDLLAIAGIRIVLGSCCGSESELSGRLRGRLALVTLPDTIYGLVTWTEYVCSNQRSSAGPRPKAVSIVVRYSIAINTYPSSSHGIIG